MHAPRVELTQDNLTHSRFHVLTLSPSHALTLSRSHALTFSRSYALTFSRSHVLTLLRSHALMLSRSRALACSPKDARPAGGTDARQPHTLTLSRSHALTFSRSHALTFSRSHVLTLSRAHALAQRCTPRKWGDLTQDNLTHSRFHVHALTFSRSHALTFSHSHVLTLSRSRALACSPRMHAPRGGNRRKTTSHTHALTLSPPPFTNSRSHAFTVSCYVLKARTPKQNPEEASVCNALRGRFTFTGLWGQDDRHRMIARQTLTFPTTSPQRQQNINPWQQTLTPQCCFTDHDHYGGSRNGKTSRRDLTKRRLKI